MENKNQDSIIKAVGTIFLKDKKLLLDKPRKRPTYQMIGGRVEDGETILESAIRECYEELGSEAIFDIDKSKFIMEFDEIATSDNITPIHFYIYKYEGTLKGRLNTSDEIEKFKWYDSSCGIDDLSNTLKNKVVPYCLEKKLITRINLTLHLKSI